MKNVYILTKEGRSFSDEGCYFIRSYIKEKFGDDSDLVFSMGDRYNDPKVLIEELTENPNSYIVISAGSSESRSLHILNGENIVNTVKLLTENPGIGSWDAIVEELMKVL